MQLWNPLFTNDQNAVLWANVVLAAVSGFFNFRSFQVSPYPFNKIRFAISLLAIFYSLGYLSLILGMFDLTTWSAFFRGVSLTAWPIVWIVPAVVGTRTWKSIREKLTDTTEGDESEVQGEQ